MSRVAANLPNEYMASKHLPELNWILATKLRVAAMISSAWRILFGSKHNY
jgi:hypothetical protein